MEKKLKDVQEIIFTLEHCYKVNREKIKQYQSLEDFNTEGLIRKLELNKRLEKTIEYEKRKETVFKYNLECEKRKETILKYNLERRYDENGY